MIKIALKAGHHWSISGTQFSVPTMECWLGGFVSFQVIKTSIVKKPYNLLIFQRVQNPCLDPPMKVFQ